MASFSKPVTMNQQATCDIPFERYFLKYAINHTKRDRVGHRLDWKVPEMKKKKKKKKTFKTFLFLIHTGHPLNYTLIHSMKSTIYGSLTRA